MALFFACMIMIGDSYCFDNPMAMQSQITKLFDIDNVEFNLLYTVYSLPNIILPFFGGVLIDKLGARIAIIIFSVVVVIGQLVCVAGAQYGTFGIMIAGRVIFGMGSESLNTSQNTIMSQWFREKELSLALGLCISIPKIGSAMNSLISPMILENNGTIAEAMLVGVGVLTFSLVCGICLIYMDWESDRREIQSKLIIENLLAGEITQQMDANENKAIKNKIHSYSAKENIKTILEKKLSQDSATLPLENTARNDDDDDDASSSSSSTSLVEEIYQSIHEAKEEINLKDIAKMSGTFWVLTIICMLTEALFVPFLDNGNEFFQVVFGFKSTQAGLFLMLPYLISAFITPILGIYVDRIGARGYMIILTAVVFLITHILLLVLKCQEICIISGIPLFFLGLCFALYASVIIPSLPMVVKPALIGTAFGLCGVFQNVALSTFPLITGLIYNQFSKQGLDPENGYMHQSFFFVGMSLFNVIVAITLLFIDRSGAKKLQGKSLQNEKIPSKKGKQSKISSQLEDEIYEI